MRTLWCPNGTRLRHCGGAPHPFLFVPPPPPPPTPSPLQVPDYVDPESVSFALCRVPIGSGAFKREKFILLHYNLGACVVLGVRVGRGGGEGRAGCVSCCTTAIVRVA